MSYATTQTRTETYDQLAETAGRPDHPQNNLWHGAMENAHLSVRLGEVELYSQDWYDLVVGSFHSLVADEAVA